jgi:hypothetical protein
VTTMSISVRHDLIARHRFLTVLYGSVLRSGSVPKLVRVLPIDMATGISVGVIRLRGRTLAPSAEVFVQAARETARPLRSLRASQLLG